MAIGETFLSAFLQVLFEKMLSPGVNMFMKVVKGGLQQEKTIKEWEKQLRIIEAVLSDAEYQQHHQLQSNTNNYNNNNNGINSWLQDLQDLAYDLEDVLDSFATQALTYQLMIKERQEHGRVVEDDDAPKFMVQSIVDGGTKAVEQLSFMLNSGTHFSVSIAKINQQLKEIVSRTKGLGLSVHVMHRQAELPMNILAMQGWRETTSLLCEPFVYGREGDKKEIIHQLLNDDNSSRGNYVVIPIVGMGGIGKTTLAQLIYNDEEVDVFDLKAWVYVSQVFDTKRVTTSIYNTITGKYNSFCDLNQAQMQLKHVLGSKRFLIVLDDVWSERYSDWNDLRTPLRAGAKGSRVVVTTRSQKVARIMNPRFDNMILLERLSSDDCWNILAQHAFDDVNISLSQNLLSMKDDMTRKCKSVPLVAKALGGLLRSKVEENEWEEMLNSNDTLSMQDTRVLQVFELSYHELPSNLKQCFAYCSLFPYDHVFTEEDVILLWMAEGFLPENVKSKQMEDMGHEYFHELVSRSFFEPSSKGLNYFKIHSLQSDLAQKVAGKLCFRVTTCSEGMNWHNASCRTRHLSLSKLDEPRDYKDLFPIQKVNHFRTFAHFDKHINPNASYQVLELIENFRYVRVLSLSHMGIITVPEVVGNLKLLRYFNLSYNNIEELPCSISNLVNLQTLLLKGCNKLQKLLKNMRCLINLRHIDIVGTSIHEMPIGIGELMNLQTLQTFIIGSNGSIIKELKTLKNLRGKLSISGLENVVCSNDAGYASLDDKSSLQELEMAWEWGNFTNGVSDNTKIDILDQLRPHKSTKVLTLKNYKGVTFPKWVGDPSFTKMVIIKLVGCERCESLPPLGKLPGLKELVIQEMRGLKRVDLEFHGFDYSNSFPALRTLKFKSMTSWESWLQSSTNINGFSCLQELSIEDCPSLKQSLPHCLPLLQKLEIQHCKMLNTSLPHLPQICKLLVQDCPCLVVVDQLPLTLQQMVISSCQKLQYVEFEKSYSHDSESISLQVLEVVNCKSLSTLLSKHRSKAQVAHYPSPTSRITEGEESASSFELSLFEEGLYPSKLGHLTKLTISECPYLISFPKDLVLPSLRNLLISVCPNLEALPKQMHQFTSLQDLIVTNCPKIHYFPKDGLPLNLISLYLDGLNIEQPLQEWELHNLKSLEKLSISDVGCSSNSIDSFPEENIWLPSSLLGLAISGFLNLKSMSCLGISNLTSLYIRRCPKLESFVENSLPPTLKELWVVQCPVLKHHIEQDPLRHTMSSIAYVRIC